jgi:hypothetical protein
MEINITRFFRECDPRDYSTSIAEIVDDGIVNTWHHAVEDSPDYMLLDSDDKREAFRAFVRSSGGWSEEEIAAWSNVELNALFLQWIAGDMRECDLTGSETTKEDWRECYAAQEAGRAPSNLFLGVDGEVYFYVGS